VEFCRRWVDALRAVGCVTSYFIYLSGAASASACCSDLALCRKTKTPFSTGMRRPAAQPFCRLAGLIQKIAADLLATSWSHKFFLCCQASPQLCRQKGVKTTSNRARQLDSNRLCIRNTSRHCCHSLPRPIGRATVCHPAPPEGGDAPSNGRLDSRYN